MTASKYEIRLKGHMDPRQSEWLGGFTMTLQPDGETVLTGLVTDQAALHGLLLRIRDLGIPLLSVNSIRPHRFDQIVGEANEGSER